MKITKTDVPQSYIMKQIFEPNALTVRKFKRDEVQKEKYMMAPTLQGSMNGMRVIVCLLYLNIM